MAQDILIKQAKNLLDKIKKSGNDFDKKTLKIISSADRTAKELSKTNLDRKLSEIEKEGAKKIDRAVFDFLS